MDLDYLNGRKFCLVLVVLHDEQQPDGKFRMKCVHGRAALDPKGRLAVQTESGPISVPTSCYPMILPSDGTAYLRDAEYFVICRVAGMQL